MPGLESAGTSALACCLPGVNAAWIVLAWGPYLVPAPGFPARPAGAFKYMVDADVCLSPQEGLFEPSGFTPYTTVLREILLADSGRETILQVVVRPSFDVSYALRLERVNPAGQSTPGSFQLRLVRAKKHVWSEMMEEMQRQQGSVIHLGEAEQERALAKVSRASDVRILAVSDDLANRLVGVWSGILARTQYVNEVLEAPDGCGIVQVKADGTTYDFWHNGRSGSTHSPDTGSLLDELVEATEALTRYVEATPKGQPAAGRQLDARLDRLQRRIHTNEPCLRPQPHDHRRTRR